MVHESARSGTFTVSSRAAEAPGPGRATLPPGSSAGTGQVDDRRGGLLVLRRLFEHLQRSLSIPQGDGFASLSRQFFVVHRQKGTLRQVRGDLGEQVGAIRSRFTLEQVLGYRGGAGVVGVLQQKPGQALAGLSQVAANSPAAG